MKFLFIYIIVPFVGLLYFNSYSLPTFVAYKWLVKAPDKLMVSGNIVSNYLTLCRCQIILWDATTQCHYNSVIVICNSTHFIRWGSSPRSDHSLLSLIIYLGCPSHLELSCLNATLMYCNIAVAMWIMIPPISVQLIDLHLTNLFYSHLTSQRAVASPSKTVPSVYDLLCFFWILWYSMCMNWSLQPLKHGINVRVYFLDWSLISWFIYHIFSSSNTSLWYCIVSTKYSVILVCDEQIQNFGRLNSRFLVLGFEIQALRALSLDHHICSTDIHVILPYETTPQSSSWQINQYRSLMHMCFPLEITSKIKNLNKIFYTQILVLCSHSISPWGHIQCWSL